MDSCTKEVRLQYWKNIILQCQARPAGQSAKQWLKDNGICEQTYYLWQKRIRQDTFEQMNISKNLPVPAETSEVSFAEISLPPNSCNSTQEDPPALSKPVAVLKTERFSIAFSNDISESLLSGILKEVLHA